MAPVPLKRHDIDIGDGLHLTVHDGGAGRPVVLIHGAGAGASGITHFQANITAFLEAGFRVIVPDLLGFGTSSKPVDDQGYPLARFTDTLATALDRLQVERAALFGNSLGGAIALDMALRMRDRVEAAVLLAPGALEERSTYTALPKVLEMSGVFARGGVNEPTMRAMLELLVSDKQLITDELVTARTAVALTQPREVASRLMLPDLSPLLPGVAVPLLVIWGEADGICPVQGAARFSRDCPDAEVIIFPGIGHWPMIERAAEVNAASLAFLSSRQ
jgi:4,5:9,10-diseco-3-hydroxy-5,9,17-trioxoandrosta-1(10),2-diene-4-oate hydrolase